VLRTGNITNEALLRLSEVHLGAIVSALGDADFAELGADALVVHRRRDDTASAAGSASAAHAPPAKNR
jgi:hypothetical protein